MTVYNWLSMFGIPTLVSGVVGIVIGYVVGLFNSSKALKEGVQAMLKIELTNMYDRCNEKGFATMSERDDFEYVYQRYHKLGANGVMDNTREKFLKLPTTNQNGVN